MWLQRLDLSVVSCGVSGGGGVLGCGVRVSVRPAPGPRVNQRVVLYSVERRALQCTETMTSNEVKQNVQKERLGRRACRACLRGRRHRASGVYRACACCGCARGACRLSFVALFSQRQRAFRKRKSAVCFGQALSLVSLINSLTSGKKLTVALKQKNTQLIMYALIRSVTHASTYIFKLDEAHHR